MVYPFLNRKSSFFFDPSNKNFHEVGVFSYRGFCLMFNLTSRYVNIEGCESSNGVYCQKQANEFSRLFLQDVWYA